VVMYHFPDVTLFAFRDFRGLLLRRKKDCGSYV
jgi:hypothetical protein